MCEIASGFELMNPTGITACAARWAFTNAGAATGGKSPGGALGTLNTIYKFGMDVDVFTTPVGYVGGAAGLANFAYGLYSAGIADTDFSSQTIEQLRGTSTMTGASSSSGEPSGRISKASAAEARRRSPRGACRRRPSRS